MDKSPAEIAFAVREHERTLKTGRKRGRTPKIAPNAQMFKALHKALIAFEKETRRQGETGRGDAGRGGGEEAR